MNKTNRLTPKEESQLSIKIINEMQVKRYMSSATTTIRILDEMGLINLDKLRLEKYLNQFEPNENITNGS